MAFRFVHAGDLHLDTPFAGLRRVDPGVADVLVDASLGAFEALVQLTIDREAAFLLLSGGIYDGPHRGIRAQTVLRRGLERLSRAGVACFLVLGDLDPVGVGWSAIRSWPPEVTVFGSDRVQTVTVSRGGEAVATIHGISHAQRGGSDNLVPRFRRTGGPGLHVGLLHADLRIPPDPAAGPDASTASWPSSRAPARGPDASTASWPSSRAPARGPRAAGASPCSLDDLRGAGLDYWALGHRHAARVTAPDGDRAAWVVEPGTLQGRGPDPAERGPKGAVVVEVDRTTVSTPEFVPLDTVRVDSATVDVTALADVTEVVTALSAVGHDRLAAADGRALVLSATLVGTGPVAGELRRPHADRTLLDRLREAADPAAGLVWWERVDDATQRDLDRVTLRQRGDLPAAVLAAADRMAADPDRLRAFSDPHLAPVGELPVPDDAGRWPAVTDLALDLLVDDR